MSYSIVCRARLSEACLHGSATAAQFGEDLPMASDRTYLPPEDLLGDAAGGSIVCDSCYVLALPFTPSGRGRLEELSAAIELYAECLEIVRDHPFLGDLVEDSERVLAREPEGPHRAAASLLLRLASERAA